jgi:protein TonB
LQRISDAITKGKLAVAQRQTQADTRTAEQIKADETAKLKAAQEAKANQAAAAAAAAALAAARPPAPAQAPAQQPVQQEAPPPAPVVSAPPPAQRPAPSQAPARSANDLVPISTPQPAYPPEAARSGTAGEVTISFTVNTDGSVSNIDIVSARPRGVFERNVQSAVRRWRFEPISGSQTVTRTFNFAR